jgi:hypothetical protein
MFEMQISISDFAGETNDNGLMKRVGVEESMSRKEIPKTPKRQHTACGVSREKTSIRDLWKEMWAGRSETNRRLRWRRWDRDLDFS